MDECLFYFPLGTRETLPLPYSTSIPPESGDSLQSVYGSMDKRPRQKWPRRPNAILQSGTVVGDSRPSSQGMLAGVLLCFLLIGPCIPIASKHQQARAVLLWITVVKAYWHAFLSRPTTLNPKWPEVTPIISSFIYGMRTLGT